MLWWRFEKRLGGGLRDGLAVVQKTVWQRSRNGLAEVERRFGGGSRGSLAEVRKTAEVRETAFFCGGSNDGLFIGGGSGDG